eukprot:1393843-Amorphochlora_amoeboformis.AAC.1
MALGTSQSDKGKNRRCLQRPFCKAKGMKRVCRKRRNCSKVSRIQSTGYVTRSNGIRPVSVRDNAVIDL